MRTAFRLALPLSLIAGITLLIGALHPPMAAQSVERTLFVSAVDRDGQPVEALGPDAFVVRENGVRREVLRVLPADAPMDIMLIVDNSTAAAREITFFREALPNFVTLMAPDNRMALVTIAERPTIVVDYTGDVDRLANAARRLFSTPQSGATLLDGLAESARGLARRDTPRAVIVAVVTDGPEFTNRYARDVVRTLTETNAALHAVTIGRFMHSEEHGLRERAFLLDEAPSATGGQRLQLLSSHALNGTLERLARELRSQYEVVYARPQTLIPPDRVDVTSAREGITMRGAEARGQNRGA